jgi:hypothetical protein
MLSFKEIIDAMPLDFIDSEIGNYPMEEILIPCHGNGLFQEQIDPQDINIPGGIINIYGYQIGEGDGESWELFGAMVSKKGLVYYFFYDASCCYTGFDCGGGMKLHVSTDYFKALSHVPDHLNRPPPLYWYNHDYRTSGRVPPPPYWYNHDYRTSVRVPPPPYDFSLSPMLGGFR